MSIRERSHPDYATILRDFDAALGSATFWYSRDSEVGIRCDCALLEFAARGARAHGLSEAGYLDLARAAWERVANTFDGPEARP